MNKMGLWFYLSLKRQTKRFFFLVLLFALPASLWWMKTAEETGEKQIKIALWAGENQWNEKATQTLVNKNGSFEFYISGSEEELREDVAAGRAECGYIFPENLKEKLESGNYKRSIIRVVSPSSTVGKLSEETVFAGIFEVWGRELLKTYAKEGAPFQGEDHVWERLEPLYDRYLEDGTTFSFQYVSSGGTALEEPSMKTAFPARGLIAVFVFVMGLGAAAMVCEDAERGLFAAMSGLRKEAAVFSCLAAPIFLASVSGLAALAASGEMGSPAAEAVLLTVYGIACTLFSWGICRIVKKPIAVACLIPFFVIGSLVLCPVFADISLFLPEVGTVRKLFLPWYYLRLSGLVL